MNELIIIHDDCISDEVAASVIRRSLHSGLKVLIVSASENTNCYLGTGDDLLSAQGWGLGEAKTMTISEAFFIEFNAVSERFDLIVWNDCLGDVMRHYGRCKDAIDRALNLFKYNKLNHLLLTSACQLNGLIEPINKQLKFQRIGFFCLRPEHINTICKLELTKPHASSISSSIGCYCFVEKDKFAALPAWTFQHVLSP